MTVDRQANGLALGALDFDEDLMRVDASISTYDSDGQRHRRARAAPVRGRGSRSVWTWTSSKRRSICRWFWGPCVRGRCNAVSTT